MGTHPSKTYEAEREDRLNDFINQSTYQDLILPRLKAEFDHIYLSKKPLDTPIPYDDLEEIRQLGSGAFATVFLVQHVRTKKFYALKVINKSKAVKMKQIEHTMNEKRIQRAARFPFLVPAYSSFKDNLNLYVVMPYLIGGDLFETIKVNRKLEEDVARFYAAQITLALEYLHYLELVYRDLKPENIMIDGNGYLKITDFGFVKYIGGTLRTWTMCGTPEYIAPEVVQCTGAGKAADWWSFGVVLYELRAGKTPFKNEHQMTMFENITEGKYTTPSNFSPSLEDLVKHLLQVDISRRFGTLYDGVADIKLHPWFATTNWSEIYYQQMVPPFVPKIRGPPSKDELEEARLSVASHASFATSISFDKNSYSTEFEGF